MVSSLVVHHTVPGTWYLVAKHARTQRMKGGGRRLAQTLDGLLCSGTGCGTTGTVYTGSTVVA